MINSIQKWSIVCLSSLLFLGVAKSATAANLVDQTIGGDNSDNSEFFSLSFDGTDDESGLLINSIAFDFDVENNHSIVAQSMVQASQAPAATTEIPEPATVLGLLTVAVFGKLGLKAAKNR